MFCTKCGRKLESGENFCTNCGQSCNSEVTSEKLESTAVATNAVANKKFPLQSDRDFFLTFLLTIVTCGIYYFIFINDLAKDVNIACEGDGEETTDGLSMFVFSLVTCGIYQFIWYYELGNRLSANASKYDISIKEDGATLLLWNIFGWLVCGAGSYISLYFCIKNLNKICKSYNVKHGFANSSYNL